MEAWMKPSKNKLFKPGMGKVKSWNTKKLFSDNDRDGVSNVFDCRPNNFKKQDWAPPRSPDTVVVRIPVKRAYHLRGEYGLRSGKISHKEYSQSVQEEMKPIHRSTEMFSMGSPSEAKRYVERIKKALQSEKPRVEMVKVYAADLEHGHQRFGEGRHRILAAKAARKRMIPVMVVSGAGHEGSDTRHELRAQEARDIQRFAKGGTAKPKPESLKHFDEPVEHEQESTDTIDEESITEGRVDLDN